ncbi:hypothetical protein [Streptomyces cavernicola]|uniref:Uncharacterized protein n=1 Tax=Streptomyces cavernicola TaxID=3043613 RepID=A0ABT6SKZ6_9ACTN|nr:hypothetical protein [Streptomyces sp. B-S-A6]MDI3408858.1 hypothetical protein [Streptomyces sp. B-S-A6]
MNTTPDTDPTPEPASAPAQESTQETTPEAKSAEQQRLVQEKKNERMVWWYLAYFLFGIHLVAFVMIYAVTHAK